MHGLDQVEWCSLGTVSGTASHVPDALRMLMSSDEKERAEGYWRIDNHVVVQSDLFPAAPYVVPFLLQLLSSAHRPGSDLVYELLFEIGNGAAPESVRSDFRLPDWPNCDLSLQQACREVVKSGLAIYLNDLKNGDTRTRLKAVELVGSLAEDDSSIEGEMKRPVGEF